MRIYEELFIIRPDSTDEDIAAVIDQLKHVVTNAGGTVDKEERWGVRKLAYKVDKRNEGYYILMQFTAGPETVRELERRLRVSDLVMKFITVRIDEKLKQIEKRKKQREKRAARKPAPAAAAPSMPASEPAMPSSPSPLMPGAPAAEPAEEPQGVGAVPARGSAGEQVSQEEE